MGLEEIRGGLASNLSTIPHLRESAYLRSNPSPPCAEVQPGPIEFDRAFARGLDDWTLTVRVMVGISTDEGAQRLLDKMLAPSGQHSVKAALEQDCTLDGAADDLWVSRCSGYRVYQREGMPALLGAEWEVQVFAAGQ